LRRSGRKTAENVKNSRGTAAHDLLYRCLFLFLQVEKKKKKEKLA
jgi:hypothetical protein